MNENDFNSTDTSDVSAPVTEAPSPEIPKSDYVVPNKDYGFSEAFTEDEPLAHVEAPTKESEKTIETKQEQETEPQNEPVTSEDESPEETEDDNSAESDDPEIRSFKLDAELAKVPGATKRWQEQMAGVEKVKTRYQELLGQAEPAISWVNRFSDPSTAAKVYQELGQVLAQQHGIPLEQFTGRAQQLATDNSELEPWEREGFDYQAEYTIYEKAKQEALKQVRAELAPYLSEMQGIKKEREQAATAAQQQAWLDSVAPKAIKLLDKTENGWKVTSDMVNAAVTAFPQLRNDPAKAVKAMYADELKQHTASVANALMAPKGPEILPSGGNTKAKEDKPWDKVHFMDYID